MNKISVAFGATILALAAAPVMTPAWAQSTMSPQDKTFLTKAATGGMAEVSLGQLAERNAASPQVKQFGEQMVTDHSKANEQLKGIAKSQNVTLPTNLDSADRATEQRLASMKGSSFDQAYMRDMVEDHQKDVQEFQQEANNGQNEALRMFAQQTLPILQQHLQMAESIAKSQK
jgi:putative membrane protein